MAYSAETYQPNTVPVLTPLQSSTDDRDVYSRHEPSAFGRIFKDYQTIEDENEARRAQFRELYSSDQEYARAVNQRLANGHLLDQVMSDTPTDTKADITENAAHISDLRQQIIERYGFDPLANSAH